MNRVLAFVGVVFASFLATVKLWRDLPRHYYQSLDRFERRAQIAKVKRMAGVKIARLRRARDLVRTASDDENGQG